MSRHPIAKRSIALIIATIAVTVGACTTSDTTTEPTTPSTVTTVPLSVVPVDYQGFLRQQTACGAEQPDTAVDMKFDAPDDAGVAGPTTVTLSTSCGPLVIELDPGTAPETVNSFVFLAEEGYFDGTVSHRVIPGFMMQAGDPTATGLGGPGYTIPDELPGEGMAYERGVVAMANAGPGTAGSQFFILFGDADWLPPDYSIFGRVTDGFTTLDAIEAIPLGQSPTSRDTTPSTPLNSLFIESVTVSR
jgi:peptidyl-prolyl cis-trans isomerase B (cyclophilin B)